MCCSCTGGISPAVASIACDDINATVRRELTADLDQTRSAPLASLAAREDGPLWYRGLAEQPDTFAPEVDDALMKQNARAIVVAHTVSPAGRIRVRFGGKVVQIDTGMQPAYVQNGRASALEIRGGQFTAIVLITVTYSMPLTHRKRCRRLPQLRSRRFCFCNCSRPRDRGLPPTPMAASPLAGRS